VTVVVVSECNCDRYGSVRVETCDVISGQCRCRSRFTGRDCSQCEVSVVVFITAHITYLLIWFHLIAIFHASWIFLAGYPSCQPTVGVPGQSTNPNQWPGLVVSSSPASLPTEGALLPLCWLSNTSTTHAARYCLIKSDSCCPGRALSPVCVCVHTAAFEWNDLQEIWFAGSPWHCLRHIWRSWVRVHGSRSQEEISFFSCGCSWVIEKENEIGKIICGALWENADGNNTMRISVWLGGGMHWTALVGCLWSSLF